MSVTGIQTSSGFVPFGGGGAVLTPTGSATRGVYVDSNNALQQMTYSVEKSVPSDAVFTDTVYTPAPVSDAYAQANAYAVGDYCIYNNTLYKCIQAKAANVDAPPTNTSYWTNTTTDQNGNTVPLTVSRELTSLNSGLIELFGTIDDFSIRTQIITNNNLDLFSFKYIDVELFNKSATGIVQHMSISVDVINRLLTDVSWQSTTDRSIELLGSPYSVRFFLRNKFTGHDFTINSHQVEFDNSGDTSHPYKLFCYVRK